MNDLFFKLHRSEGQASNLRVNVKNGTPSAEIHVNLDAVIDEEVGASTLDEGTIEKIEVAAIEKMKDVCNDLLTKVQEEGSDIFGFGARIKAKFRSENRLFALSRFYVAWSTQNRSPLAPKKGLSPSELKRYCAVFSVFYS